MKLEIYQIIQAGLTSLEKIFDEVQWEEELTVFTLEHVGLGKKHSIYIISTYLLLALIINAVGLVAATILFVAEIIFHQMI